jgi:hypothetical protein
MKYMKKVSFENLEMTELKLKINHYESLSKLLIIMSGIGIAFIAIISVLYSLNILNF